MDSEAVDTLLSKIEKLLEKKEALHEIRERENNLIIEAKAWDDATYILSLPVTAKLKDIIRNAVQVHIEVIEQWLSENRAKLNKLLGG